TSHRYDDGGDQAQLHKDHDDRRQCGAQQDREIVDLPSAQPLEEKLFSTGDIGPSQRHVERKDQDDSRGRRRHDRTHGQSQGLQVVKAHGDGQCDEYERGNEEDVDDVGLGAQEQGGFSLAECGQLLGGRAHAGEPSLCVVSVGDVKKACSAMCRKASSSEAERASRRASTMPSLPAQFSTSVAVCCTSAVVSSVRSARSRTPLAPSSSREGRSRESSPSGREKLIVEGWRSTMSVIVPSTAIRPWCMIARRS